MALLPIALDIHWDELPVGTRFRTRKRTVTETDLVGFVNLTWLTEELFGNADPGDRAAMGIAGRVVPGGLVYTFAEGLVAPSFQAAGLAFLHTEIDMQAPTLVGDTLHVDCEVVEQRATSKPDRGLVRTRNTVLNQRGTPVLVYTPLRLMRRRPT
ncbi:MaoC family dehydratase [Pseudorhodoferax sp.]|uniref:MaoC family dehydratase n=1 Tax=Pseudorhodoferax sp. TaxID=1993553 RepID=UPI002DD642AF|nr:MaoC family dehydratase N-terminal domain-containing protein [Pseudorhodoferax sp.]